MTVEMEVLQCENEDLRWKASNSDENKPMEGGEHSTKGTNTDKASKKKMHDKLCSLMEKLEEMARKIG